MQRFASVVCLAAGPGELLGVLEIIEAARIYMAREYRVIVVDDTADRQLARRLRRYREVDVLRNDPRNGLDRLVESLQRAYLHALERYDFAALLKVDCDALLIGPGLDRDIVDYFAANPQAGMLGSRCWRERDDAMWADRLRQRLDYWGPLMERAGHFGYQPGESALGGAYAVSRACLNALLADGLLPIRPPVEPRIGEDVTFSLLVRALGFEIHEFAAPPQPLALAWRGLPEPRQTLAQAGKKAIHSVKFTRHDLRARDFFARRRAAAARSAADGSVEALAISRSLRRHLRWAPLAERALRHRHRATARRLLTWLVARRPLRPWLWTMLVLSVLPRPVFDALMRARRAALGLGQARDAS